MVGCHVIKTLEDFHIDPTPGKSLVDARRGAMFKSLCIYRVIFLTIGTRPPSPPTIPKEDTKEVAIILEEEGDALDVRHVCLSVCLNVCVCLSLD